MSNERLGDTTIVKCGDCDRTYDYKTLDWSKKKEICIGVNDSWGNWKVYKYVIKCPGCGNERLSDGEVVCK